ncbi:ABC transporter permease subunit [Pantoea sp. 1.19]|uniref:ABC transporter permease subunit n=1 Tax=Pantoea sp. 1.19 TaxID=1925589 RepID=UPI0009490C63|nr:ABC transporter permease subunit [Pantoea sp. 1.19]
MRDPLYCQTCPASHPLRFLPSGAAIPLLSRVLTLLAVVLLVGLLPWLSDQDPALALLRARAAEQEATPEALAAIRQSLGLDRGPLGLLAGWLRGLLHGDAGVSWISGRPVMPGMLQALRVSLTLMSFAALLALAVALLVALPTFMRGLRGTPQRPGGAIAAALTALPEFLLATVLLVVGAVWLGLFAPYGWHGPRDAVLPALAMGLPAGGYLGRLFADALAATFSEPWVLTWRAAGIVRRHLLIAAVKRALATVMPLTGLVLVSLAGSAVAVEKVFAIPGLGRATLGAVMAQDLPTLQLGILLLLLLAGAAGTLAGALRLAILGRALRSRALPARAAPHRPRSVRAGWLPLGCLLLLALLLACGLPRDPYASDFMRLAPPSLSLPFGADALGRDLLARVAHGTLYTCLLALAVSLCCLLLGMLLGAFPRLMQGPTEAANALPPVIAGLLVVALMGPGTLSAAVAVAAVAWAPLASHTAALVTEIHARPWMSALPVVGVDGLRRQLRYVVPALAGPLFRHAMLRLPGIALALAAVGFLGLGTPPPEPEWGRILAEGMPYLERGFWCVLAPAGALVLLSVLAVSLAHLAAPARPKADRAPGA